MAICTGRVPKLTQEWSLVCQNEVVAVEPLRLLRENSWLSFNRRVLMQAQRADFPLLERLRFLCIFQSNLDEFFLARVHPLQTQARAAAPRGATWREYKNLLTEAGAQMQLAAKIKTQLLRQLAHVGLIIIEPHALTEDEAGYFGAFLAEKIVPKTDLISLEHVELLDSRTLYLAAGDTQLRAMLRVPDAAPRLLQVPGRPGTAVRLEALMQSRPDLFLPTPLKLAAFRITRRANIELHGQVDWDDLAHAIESRLDGPVARLETEIDFPWQKEMQAKFMLHDEEVFSAKILDLRLFETWANLNRAKLRFAEFKRRRHRSFTRQPFVSLRVKDFALYHPHDDYSTVVDFLASASRDPKVKKVRATLYRLGQRSPIAEALVEAAKRGKDVAVFLEGRARFDELSNFYWLLRFREAGVRVLPYPADTKVHAKALLVTRGERAYLHVGTGNYNPVTGALYTDLSLFTANKDMVSDAQKFFKALEEGKRPTTKTMRVGLAARETLIECIRAEANPKGHIILKLNHLTDPTVLEELSAAAEAGARVDLIVRSSLTLIHPKFRVRSIVGRYLEHARIAAFKRKGKWEVWAGSADWMARNFERRIELVFPIVDASVRRRVLRLLQQQLQDDVNAFELLANGQQRPRWGGKKNSQIERL